MAQDASRRIPSRTPHDALFRFAFRDPRNAASALRGLLPRRVRDRIDFSTLQVVPGSFVRPELTARFSDRLFRVRLAGQDGWIFILYEHQSRPDALMPLRIIEYVVLIWRDWLREHPGATRLPPILPVVLHHGDTGWTAPRSLGAMYDLEPDALAALSEWLPQLNLFIDDLSAESVEAIEARGMTGMATLTMLCLKLGRTEADLAALFARKPDALRETWQAGGRDALIALLLYTLQVNGADEPQLERAVRRAIGERGQEVVMTATQKLMQEAHARGRLEGREEGREEGRVEGQRAVLLRLTEQRFGALTSQERDRLQALESARLDSLLERLLTARSFDELLAEDR